MKTFDLLEQSNYFFSHSSLQNRPHTNYSRQRSIAIKPRFKSSVKFKKINCLFYDKKQLVDLAVVKELDEETNLYYYGARYLDPRTSRWLTGDPAIWQGDYIPVAPINDDARKHNQNLPGMGGVFNTVNMHAYHYAGNNPVKYVDPDGRDSVWEIDRFTNTIRIEIPVRFEEGTTLTHKEYFYAAAKEWEGRHNIGGIDFDISINIVEVNGSDTYRGVRVNSITFSPIREDHNGEPPFISNVAWSYRMTLFTNYSYDILQRIIKHEIGHLFGLQDRYHEERDGNGNRYAPPYSGWESNIMGRLSPGNVETRNFTEAIGRDRINRKIYIGI